MPNNFFCVEISVSKRNNEKQLVFRKRAENDLKLERRLWMEPSKGSIPNGPLPNGATTTAPVATPPTVTAAGIESKIKSEVLKSEITSSKSAHGFIILDRHPGKSKVRAFHIFFFRDRFFPTFVSRSWPYHVLSVLKNTPRKGLTPKRALVN